MQANVMNFVGDESKLGSFIQRFEVLSNLISLIVSPI